MKIIEQLLYEDDDKDEDTFYLSNHVKDL